LGSEYVVEGAEVASVGYGCAVFPVDDGSSGHGLVEAEVRGDAPAELVLAEAVGVAAPADLLWGPVHVRSVCANVRVRP